jgi:hypothetical protein
VPGAIEAALNKVLGTRSVALDAPDTALRVMTRRLKDADVYFFFNESAQPFSQSLTLTTSGKKVEMWDAQTGTVSQVADAASAAGAVKLKMDLKPYETRLLVAH